MRTLRDELIRIQRERDLTDREMAALIGISPAMWTQVRNGNRRPGRKTMLAVKRAFPALSLDFLLASEADNSGQMSTSSKPSRAPSEAPDARGDGHEGKDTTPCKKPLRRRPAASTKERAA